MLLEPDRTQIDRFADLIFRHVPAGYISLRSFNSNNSVFKIEAVHFNGGGMAPVCDAAEDLARRCAAARTEKNNVVFCPPVAVFKTPDSAAQEDLLSGPALSVELDVNPEAALERLVGILGKPTVVVRSGGEWVNPETGEVENKLHAHWRLAVPASGDDLAKLKRARVLASTIAGGDHSNDPVSHPIRWPGSWHQKGEPRLCEIEEANDDIEIDLTDVLAKLEAEAPEVKAPPTEGDKGKGPEGWAEEITNILAGNELHDSIAVMAAKLIASGMGDGAAVNLLRGFMDQSAARVSRFLEWTSRRDDIPRAVSTAREKYERPASDVTPIDLWAKLSPPDLPRGLLPPVIERFAVEQGEMMGADPAGLAMAALAVCGAAIPDCVQVQVKKHDSRWLECTRLWVAPIGDPSSKKSPMIKTAAAPLVKIDAAMAKEYAREKQRYDALSKDDREGETPPKRERVVLGDATTEAAQEILRDSPDGVLCLRDELSGWFGSMDKYSAGRGAAADRGFWLTAYNGGPSPVDRIARGSCYIENLSISLLGGIQPAVLRKIISDCTDDGLIQRLMPVIVKPATVGKDEERDEVVKVYDNLVEQLHRGPTKGAPDFNKRVRREAVIRFSDGAQKVRRRLEQLHVDLTGCETVTPKLAAHIGKYDGIFARLCLIWRCVEHPRDWESDITEDTAERVARFLHKFLLPHAVAFYSSAIGMSDDQDRLEDLAGCILAHQLETVTYRDVARYVRSMKKLKRAEVTAILEQLDALGWLTQIPGPRAGSPSQWRVNPECRRLFAERAESETERRKKARAAMNEAFAKVGR